MPHQNVLSVPKIFLQITKAVQSTENYNVEKNPTSKSNIVTDNTRYKSSNVQSSHLSNDASSNKHSHSDQRKSYAHVKSNQSNNHAHSLNPIPPDVDVNKIISSFLEEFKSPINPLLSLLTIVISNLLEKKND